jgi:hypothetical protein
MQAFSGARPSRLCGQQASRLLFVFFGSGETPDRRTAETAVLLRYRRVLAGGGVRGLAPLLLGDERGRAWRVEHL